MIRFPERALYIVRQMMDDADAAHWGIGDVVNELSAEFEQPVAVVARHLAYEVGGNDHTFRDYAFVSGRVPLRWRSEYPLTRHQWKACLSAGDEYLEVARWAVENADNNGGRPMSVRAIRAYVMGVSAAEYDAEADEYVTRYIKRTEALLYTGAYDERAPEWLRSMYRAWIDQLAQSSSSARKSSDTSSSRS